jgi:hypothetical protein
MLLVSSCDEDAEPLDDGRDERKRDLSPPEDSRCRVLGDLGDVNGESPDGGGAVRMTGGLAANSSRETSSCLI